MSKQYLIFLFIVSYLVITYYTPCQLQYKMYKFILKNPKLFILTSSIFGLTAGHLYARRYSSPYTSQYLSPYESQDQVFHILDTTNKPVVLYYHMGLCQHDPVVRKQLFKYSTLYHDRATWMIVSYKQHAAHINSNVAVIPNDTIALELRLPKKQQSVQVGENQFQDTEDYLNFFFDGRGDARQVKHFLEKHAVIEVNDGMQAMREVAQQGLFGEVFTK